MNMGFYSLSKEERQQLTTNIYDKLVDGIESNYFDVIVDYFEDDDTYIRKATYLQLGKLFYAKKHLQKVIIGFLNKEVYNDAPKVRQTVINAAGEIGKFHFSLVKPLFDIGLVDEHHSVRNAVIGSMKKMGEKDPLSIIEWSKPFLTHESKEIRRQVCHGLELRGRTHPQDVLPLLKLLEFDEEKRVKTTLIHVLGQISYKNGCLSTVIAHLNTWENDKLIALAIDEIVDVHDRYKSFAVLTQDQAIAYISTHFNNYGTT